MNEMLEVGSIRCCSCGWDSGELAVVQPKHMARAVHDHLNGCPRRLYGHAAFGFEPRWQRFVRYDGPGNAERDHIEIAWSTSAWGLPFNMELARG